ncbi:hypothetical protein FHS43_004166 [Streptosporangium becharense]|uniref:Uncharacterized protein n=1 Tax=Streptosporangium becharense TaxID=1816182 RepID=A0A7W9IDN8_9ACTN|nr:hypothetical protein [Streptosporangium becharense]MBB2912871.1 hypothetical protein [Streptosporangium becharense]MBB5818304.1 hypothetical protein [Streptosporangium becharense]
MILISAGLVLTAIVLLIAGFVLTKPFLVMWSIAVSVLSAVFLVIGALLRRHELFPGASAGASPPQPPQGPLPPGAVPAPHGVPNRPPAPHGMVPPGVPQAAVVPPGVPQAATVPPQPRRGPAAGPATAVKQGGLGAEAIVLVIPGRKRYHIAGCRQLAGRDHEELTHEEAREEGFTPCTTCLPEFTAAPLPQEAPPGAKETAGPPAAAREPAPAGGVPESGPREPGPHEPHSRTSGSQPPGSPEPDRHEATARFVPPYTPVTRQGPSQASPVAPEAQPVRRDPQPAAAENAVSRATEPEATVSRPAGPEAAVSEAAPPLRAAKPAAPAEPAEPQVSAEPTVFLEPLVSIEPPAPVEPSAPADPQVPAEPQEPAESSASTVTSFPVLPPIPEIPHAESSATNWFSRDEATRSLPPESAEPSADEGGTPSEQEEASAGRPAPSGSPAAAEGPVADAGESSGPVPRTGSGTAPAEPVAAGPEPSRATGADPEPVRTETTGSAGPESGEIEIVDDEPETGGAVSAGHADEDADEDPEPVEPAETEPGRPTAADSASPRPATRTTAPVASPGPDDERDEEVTSPGGLPVIKDEPRPVPGTGKAEPEAGGATVKIISGTRRFHEASCPIVKGADIGGTGVETMSRAEAEEAGLSGCPICRNDR